MGCLQYRGCDHRGEDHSTRQMNVVVECSSVEGVVLDVLVPQSVPAEFCL